MWKGEYRGQNVAVKDIRTYSNSDLQKMTGVSFWLCPLSVSRTLTVSCVEVLQRGRDVEKPSTSECPAADRSNNVRNSVRDGVRLDGEWKHQRLREDTSRCKPLGAGGFFGQSRTVFAFSSLTIG